MSRFMGVFDPRGSQKIPHAFPRSFPRSAFKLVSSNKGKIMFVKRDYRDRAMGLVAALAVLAVGIKVTGAMATPRAPEPTQAVLAAEYTTEQGASDFSLARRSELTVPFC
jgi:hypothetical protein